MRAAMKTLAVQRFEKAIAGAQEICSPGGERVWKKEAEEALCHLKPGGYSEVDELAIGEALATANLTNGARGVLQDAKDGVLRQRIVSVRCPDDLMQLRGVERLVGHLIIYDETGRMTSQDFEHLAMLKEVDGDVRIHVQANLDSFEGFRALTRVGDLRIAARHDEPVHPYLRRYFPRAGNLDLSGFRNLEQANCITVRHQNQTELLDAFPALKSVDHIEIDSDRLRIVDGFNALTEARYILVVGKNIQAVRGFGNLDEAAVRERFDVGSGQHPTVPEIANVYNPF